MDIRFSHKWSGDFQVPDANLIRVFEPGTSASSDDEEWTIRKGMEHAIGARSCGMPFHQHDAS